MFCISDFNYKFLTNWLFVIFCMWISKGVRNKHSMKKGSIKMKENIKKYNFLKFNLRGHCLWLHLCWWTGNPLHSLPPLTGAGLLHSRVLVIVPNPHVTLHVEKLDQGDQLPSSREIHMCQLLKWFQLLKYLFYDDKIQFCMCYWITASFPQNGVNYQFNFHSILVWICVAARVI